MKIPLVLCLLAASPLMAADKSEKSSKVEETSIVTIGGQVRRPGPVAMNNKLTIYQAIQAAGGASEFGAMRRVKVIRDGEEKIYDLTKTKNMELKVEPDDTIVVPQKNLFGR